MPLLFKYDTFCVAMKKKRLGNVLSNDLERMAVKFFEEGEQGGKLPIPNITVTDKPPFH